ncbi:MAG: glycosyltransferase family 4 protein, partial [Solirubrobacteraceae bacterium]|nr:glycosyltransferase family 4 protein [Solirubrobacteraceae bacterium]
MVLPRAGAMTATPRRVTVLRGSAANPWDLGAWEHLEPDYDVRVLVPENNQYDVSGLDRVRGERIATLASKAKIKGGTLPHVVAGDHYLGLKGALKGSDVVHAAELSYWFTAQAARLKDDLGFKLVTTVWETIPFGRALRNARSRRYRSQVLAATDLFVCATERARDCMLLEGADPARLVVSAPGINTERFAAARTAVASPDGVHTILSIGRLVWEKGHQDLLRALALLQRRGVTNWRLVIVGVGPELEKLQGHAADLGIAGRVEFKGWMPYDELPTAYAQASCLVLASLGMRQWEEQFGMVLAEAMAAHVPVLAASSGAIPEVVGEDGTLFAPGDWQQLAQLLADGPLAGEPGTRRVPSAERIERYSTSAAA